MWILLVAAAAAAYFGYDAYMRLYAPNVPDKMGDEYLRIPTGSTYEDLRSILQEGGYVRDLASFDWVAKKMQYGTASAVRPGRFHLTPGMGNRALVRLLRNGKQSPVKLVLVNERLATDVAGKAARFIEADSASIMALLNDQTYLAEQGYNQDDLLTLFIPNTYEFFWNTSAQQFFERMMKENARFWNDPRKAKAKALGLSEKEVYALASIVERETNRNDEKARVAGVYLNRLKRGEKLQADPTVVFAVGDFGLKRILNKHLEFDSPYNTYMYTGLPPGPISLASITSIDAVLNAEQHEYLFFCAKPDASGYHAFAKTYEGHLVNAKRYHDYLATLGRQPNEK